MTARIAPYGTWDSPVSVALMTGGAIGLGGLTASDDWLYWLESRPQEAGRSTLMRWRRGAEPREVTPAPIDVGNRVHEYGGGAYAVAEGQVVFSDKRDGSVWLIDLAHASPPRPVACVAGCRYADFAIDLARGRVIAVREDHRGRPATDPGAALVSLDLTTATAPQANAGVVLVEGPDFLAAPRIAPDGSALAWIAWNHPDMPWDRTMLVVAGFAADGTLRAARHTLGEAGAEAIVQPEWIDAGTLYFCGDRTSWWQIFRWSPGHEREPVPLLPASLEATEIGGPAWGFAIRFMTPLADGQVLAAAISAAERRAVLIDRTGLEDLPSGACAQAPVPYEDGFAAIETPADAPAALVVRTPREASPGIVLRRATDRVLAPDDVARGEPFAFATSDGATAYAVFYPPRNARFAAPSDARPPLITLVHGGPTAMSARAFALSIQWWTSRGFAVVDVNYRGSTGFGRAYREALYGQWGVADVADCAAAVRHLIATDRVDPARIAIRGGSAGGFTALAALTTTDLFTAGACLYGIGDLMLLARDTHKFESRYLDRLIGPLPEAAALFAARSPINHLDRLTAPVIFFQGAEDRVVPPNQAETMVAQLKARGVPVAHYLFDGEGHGFRKAETIRRVLTLELGFYGRVWGFEPAGLSERVILSGDA